MYLFDGGVGSFDNFGLLLSGIAHRVEGCSMRVVVSLLVGFMSFDVVVSSFRRSAILSAYSVMVVSSIKYATALVMVGRFFWNFVRCP